MTTDTQVKALSEYIDTTGNIIVTDLITFQGTLFRSGIRRIAQDSGLPKVLGMSIYDLGKVSKPAKGKKSNCEMLFAALGWPADKSEVSAFLKELSNKLKSSPGLAIKVEALDRVFRHLRASIAHHDVGVTAIDSSEIEESGRVRAMIAKKPPLLVIQ